MKTVALKEDHSSMNIVDWCQITETTPREEFEQQKQQKWLAHEPRRENNDMIKC